MSDINRIREDMGVVDITGNRIGTVDRVEGDTIRLKSDASVTDASDSNAERYVPLTAVSSIDDAVHLNTTATALGLGAGAGAAAGVLPPVRNRAVDDGSPRRNFYLPWIVGAIGIVLLILLLRSCGTRDVPPPLPQTVNEQTAGTPALPVQSVTLPDGTTVQIEEGSLNFALQQYLASNEAVPRTFAFDKLNFDTGAAAIRSEDDSNIEALARILAAYPAARADVAGYTDTQGDTAANAQLGQQRADAVVSALTQRGIDGTRLRARSGGETNPADTNATGTGRFENRRTELIVTAK